MQEIIITAISTGVITQIANYLVQRRRIQIDSKKSDNDITMSMMEKLELDNKRLREEEETNSKRLVELERRLTELTQTVMLMESAHQDLPLPQWLKDRNGIMLAFNQSYEETFLVPIGVTKNEYIGRSDYDIWPEEIAKQYAINDRKVLLSRVVWEGEEDVQTPDGVGKWRVIKYPRFSGNILIGIAGIAIPPVNYDSL